jgi:rhodanese-related sulfurtransferase
MRRESSFQRRSEKLDRELTPAEKRIPFRKALWQASVLVFLALVLGVGTNQWRGDSLPLIGDWSMEARFTDASGNSLTISLDESVRLFESGDVLFLDARPESRYAEGHIDGALNLPWQDLDRYFMDVIDRLDGQEAIITYCDGEDCDLSHELALFLNEMGFENVYVLINGWTVWREAELPTGGGL